MSKTRRNFIAKELWTPKFRPKRQENKKKYEKKWLESQASEDYDE